MQKICKICGNPFEASHGNKKICGDPECYKEDHKQRNVEYEKRYKEDRREKQRINMQESRKRWGYKNKNIKGTGTLGQHALTNVEEEKSKIKAELERLGLR